MSAKTNVPEIVDVSGKITINEVHDDYGEFRQIISKICAQIPKLVPFTRLTEAESDSYYYKTLTPKMLLSSDNHMVSGYCLRNSIWFTDQKPYAYLRFSRNMSTITEIAIEVGKKDKQKINRLVNYLSNQLKLDVNIEVKPFLE